LIEADVGQNFFQQTDRCLQSLGYEPTEFTVGFYAISEENGYSPAETASKIALITMAKGIRSDIEDKPMHLFVYPIHATSILKILKEWKEHGMMHPTEYQNIVSAFMVISTLHENWLRWINEILEEPFASYELAKNVINYDEIWDSVGKELHKDS
jgi:hypothetical protein